MLTPEMQEQADRAVQDAVIKLKVRSLSMPDRVLRGVLQDLMDAESLPPVSYDPEQEEMKRTALELYYTAAKKVIMEILDERDASRKNPDAMWERQEGETMEQYKNRIRTLIQSEHGK